jgi:hypothetical protein
MVVALVALAVALSGSAYAAVSSINGGELKNRSVAAIKLEQHTLTANEINKAQLGQVPSAANATHANVAGNADALGGIAPTGFVHGTGHRALARLVLTPAAASDHELLRLPGFLDVRAGCFNSTNPPTANLSFTNLDANTIDVVRTVISHSSTDPITTDAFSLGPLAQAANGDDVPGSDVMRFGSGSGATAKVAIVTTRFNNDGGTCRVSAEADFSG